MHELSIAQSLIELVEDELATRAAATMRGTDPPACAPVGRVTVRVGALSGVVPEALASAWSVAVLRSAVLRRAGLTIDRQPAVVWCPACLVERELPDPPQRMRCPACGAPTPELRAGRELELTSIEVSEDATNDHDGTGPGRPPAATGLPTAGPADPAGPDADPEEERRDRPVAP
ncbi:MAG TPA: hydrogenase maturation nickel metallochaperone HypA [Humisphaera sp.]